MRKSRALIVPSELSSAWDLCGQITVRACLKRGGTVPGRRKNLQDGEFRDGLAPDALDSAGFVQTVGILILGPGTESF